MYVRDIQGNEYPLQVTSTNDLELNGNQNLSLRILPTKVNKMFINDISEMWEVVDHDDVRQKIIYFSKKGEGDSLTVDIKAIPLFFDDFNRSRIYEEYNEHFTAAEFFNLLFNGTDYTFVLVDSFNAIQWEGLGGGSTRLEIFKDGLNRYKAEFELSGNTVYLKSLVGRDTQFMYRYKLNASNIIRETDASAYYTYAKGYGNYENEWQEAKIIREYTSPLASIIGKREAPPIKDGRITTNTTMDSQLKTLVDESLKISVSATIHDLRKQGYALAQPQLGDRVFLIDERIGLNEEVRVSYMSLKRDWLGNVIDLQLTFGSPGIVKRYQSNLQSAIKNINGILDGKVKIPFNALDNAVAIATKALQDAQSELSFGAHGILAVDKKNPNLVTIFNSAGLGVSKDGGHTFGQAITGNGIVADYIVTGTLRGIYIEGVEISGSTIISELNSATYTHIENAYLESRGRHTRSWRGRTTTHDIKLRLENGYFRARNDNQNWSLYFSDYGISTYNDAVGDNDASGYIEFHSSSYSPSNSNSGLTIGSIAGRVAIETENSRIYLNPNGASVQVADMSDRYYPIYASQFNNSSSITMKTNISDLEISGLKIINNLQVKKYIYQSDVDNGQYDNWQVGVISELSPEIATLDLKAVNINKWLGYITKAIQELTNRVVQAESNIEDLQLILGGEPNGQAT